MAHLGIRDFVSPVVAIGDAESAQGISPRAAHRFGRETLTSSGSCHPKEGCRLPSRQEFLRLSVDSIPMWMTCSLRSTGVTPLPHYYEAVRPWPVHRYFRPRGSATCALSLVITDPVLKFPTRAKIRVMPSIRRIAWAVSRWLPYLSQSKCRTPVLMSSEGFFRRFFEGEFALISRIHT